MRDPSGDKKTERDERAIKDARRYLTRLRVVSLKEGQTAKPADELQAAIAVLRCIVDDADPPKRRRVKASGPKAKRLSAPETLALIKDVIRTILPILNRARPAESLHGRYASEHTFRDQVIRETVTLVCHQHGFKPTCGSASRDLNRTQNWACPIVSKALQELGINLTAKSVQNIWEKYPASWGSITTRHIG